MLNPDFAIGVRTEMSEADTFTTKKVRAMQGHRTNFLRKKKCGIVRRIPRPIVNSGLKYIGIVIAIWGFFLLRPYHLQNTGLMYIGDDQSYFAHASSLAFFKFPSYTGEDYIVGKSMPLHSIGPGIMSTPFVFCFAQIDRILGSKIAEKREYSNIKSSWALFGFSFSTMFYFVAASLLLYYALRFYFCEQVCFLAVTFFILMQLFPLYVYRRPVFSHIYEFFLQSFFVYLLLKNYKTNFLLKSPIKFPLLVGIAAGMIILVRYNNIFFALVWPLLLFCAKGGSSKLAAKQLTVVCIAAFTILLLFKFIPDLYNGPQLYGGAEMRLFGFKPLHYYFLRVLHIIFGIDWGIIFTAPFVILSVWGYSLINDGFFKKLFFAFSLPVAVNLYVVIMWGTQASWYGYRYLLFSLIPLLIYPFAYLIETQRIKYGLKKIALFLTLTAVIPVISMLSFEGNASTLTLTGIQQYFGVSGYGNNTYHLEILREIMFNTKEYLVAVLKGGPLYAVYVFSYFTNILHRLPAVTLEKYPEFRIDILLKTLILYITPILLCLAAGKIYPGSRVGCNNREENVAR